MKDNSIEGYRKNSPDRKNPYNIIKSNKISMRGVMFPVLGISDLGEQILMQPEQDYEFNGSSVFEIPMRQKGGSIKWKIMQEGGEKQDNLVSPAYFKELPKSIQEKRERDIMIEKARLKQLAEKEAELKKHYSRTDVVGGMKTKPTNKEISQLAQQSIDYNKQLSDDPIGTLGPDIAISVIPELMMMKGPSQAFNKVGKLLNPFKESSPWSKEVEDILWYNKYHKGNLKNIIPSDYNGKIIERGVNDISAIEDFYKTGIIRNKMSADLPLNKRSLNYKENVFFGPHGGGMGLKSSRGNYVFEVKNNKELLERPVTYKDVVDIKMKQPDGKYISIPNWKNRINIKSNIEDASIDLNNINFDNEYFKNKFSNYFNNYNYKNIDKVNDIITNKNIIEQPMTIYDVKTVDDIFKLPESEIKKIPVLNEKQLWEQVLKQKGPEKTLETFNNKVFNSSGNISTLSKAPNIIKSDEDIRLFMKSKQRVIDWVNSDEWIARRMKTANETFQEAKKAQQSTKYQIDKINDYNLKNIDKSLQSALGSQSYDDIMDQSIINIMKENPDIMESAMKHEIIHAGNAKNRDYLLKGQISPIFDEGTNAISKGAINYLKTIPESQVRGVKTLMYLQDKGLYKSGEVTDEMVDYLIKNSYKFNELDNDVSSLIVNTNKQELKKYLNSVYSLIPLGIGLGLSNKKKQGGVTWTLLT